MKIPIQRPMVGKAGGSGPPAKASKAVEAARRSVQEWLPVRDISGGLLILRDGSPVAVLELEAPSLALRSEGERRRLVRGLHEALQVAARYGFQILSLPRPIDLDSYLDGLRRMAQEAQASSPRRARLLREYLGYVSTAVAGGEALERRSYLLLRLPARKGAEAELRSLQSEAASALQRAGIEARPLDDAGLAELCFVYLHPAQAAFERFALPPVTTVLEVRLDEPTD